MQIVIDISEKDYEKVQHGRAPVIVMRNAIRNGTPIPDNPTNGDVIQILFPNICESFSNIFDLNLWWNAKYKAESEG